MTDHSDRYYRSAGAVPFSGILLMMGAGMVAAAICGGLYAAADWYIAYDIVPFLCAPLAGVAIGGVVKWGGTLGRVRHRGFLALVGLVMGALGAYFSWVCFLRMLPADPLMPQFGTWVWDPSKLVRTINDITVDGIWDNQPTGIWLKLIYTGETLTIMIASAIIAAQESRPFCDPCNAWTRQVPQTATLKLTDPEALQERLEESQYEALDELFDPAASPGNCFRATVFCCPQCTESNYLTVSHFTLVQKGGETHQNDERFINYLWVPTEVVDQVQRLASAYEQAQAQQIAIPEPPDTEAGDDSIT